MKTILSLAISLTDNFTGKNPIGHVDVYLKELNKKSIENKSGYHLFLDLEKYHQEIIHQKELTVEVKSSNYFDTQKKINLSDMIKKRDNKNKEPLISIDLIPFTSYPFSQNMTLIRGIVNDASDAKPIPDAVVKVVDDDKIKSTTTNKGEFVLYLKDITNKDIVIKNNTRLINHNTNISIELEIFHPNYKKIVKSLEVEANTINQTTISLEARK